jgi:hypothetical protein
MAVLQGTIPLPGLAFLARAIPESSGRFVGRLDVLAMLSGAIAANAFLVRRCPAQLFADDRDSNTAVCHQVSSRHEATLRANQLRGSRPPLVAFRRA